MVVPIFIFERKKYGIDGVEERPPDVEAFVCWALCKCKGFIEEYLHVGK